MLVQLSSSVQDCYRRAAEAHNRAALTDDPEYKRFLLEMEERWLTLAQSIQLSQATTEFAQDRLNRLS
jgi:hypothetical protein